MTTDFSAVGGQPVTVQGGHTVTNDFDHSWDSADDPKSGTLTINTKVGATFTIGFNSSGSSTGTWIGGSGSPNGEAGVSIDLTFDLTVLTTSVTPTQPEWDTTNGGVDWGYQVSGDSVPKDTQASLYWSPTATYDKSTATLISGTTNPIPEGTAEGSHDLPEVSLATLQQQAPPPGTQYILAVTDPNNVLGNFDPSQNVTALALPNLTISYFNWNQDRDGTVENAGHRGIDVGYSIAHADLSVGTDIEFYWSDSPDFSGKNLLVQDFSTSADSRPSPVMLNLQQQQGNYGKNGDSLNSFADYNDPARWGPAPSWANYLLAVADSNHEIVEAYADATQPYRSGMIWELPLATPDEIMTGAVTVTPLDNGKGISASFTPGGGASLSEAEVVMGVDHFNWRQEVVFLPNSAYAEWEPITLNNINPSESNNNISLNATTGQLYYSDTGDPINYTIAHLPFYDPVVTPSGQTSTTEATRAFIVNTPWGEGIIIWENSNNALSSTKYPVPDGYPFLYNEDGRSDTFGSIYHTTSQDLSFADEPEQATWTITDTQGNPEPISPFGSGDAINFETRLVGVSYGYESNPATSYEMWGADQGKGVGWKTNFTWSSDAITTGSGGATFTGSWGSAVPLTGQSPITGGGVFNVRFDDGTPVASFPTEAPSYPGTATTTTAISATTAYSNSGQNVILSATVTSTAGAVNEGSVAFLVFDSDNKMIGSTISEGVTDGSAKAIFRLPGGTAPGLYSIEAAYNGGSDFQTSLDTKHTLTVNSALTFSPTSVPAGTVGVALSQVITASGGTGDNILTYTVTSGTLPAGLKITSKPNELVITGTPTTSGTVHFTVTATDATGDKTSQSYTLTVAAARLPTPSSPPSSPSPSSRGGNPGASQSITNSNQARVFMDSFLVAIGFESNNAALMMFGLDDFRSLLNSLSGSDRGPAQDAFIQDCVIDAYLLDSVSQPSSFPLLVSFGF